MSETENQHTIELSLPSILGYERIAMDSCASLARLMGVVPDRIEDLKTAVSEACINAMEHGNELRPESRVVVTLQCTGDAMCIWVKDQGKGFIQPPEPPDIIRKLERLQTPRGMGMFLIEQLVDHVDFNKETEDGHIVSMTVRLKEREEKETET